MRNRIGQENYRVQRGRGYRVAPEVLATLGVTVDKTDSPTGE